MALSLWWSIRFDTIEDFTFNFKSVRHWLDECNIDIKDEQLILWVFSMLWVFFFLWKKKLPPSYLGCLPLFWDLGVAESLQHHLPATPVRGTTTFLWEIACSCCSIFPFFKRVLSLWQFSHGAAFFLIPAAFFLIPAPFLANRAAQFLGPRKSLSDNLWV